MAQAETPTTNGKSVITRVSTATKKVHRGEHKPAVKEKERYAEKITTPVESPNIPVAQEQPVVLHTGPTKYKAG